MLPPRHQRAAKRAFWIYWPRRFLSRRGFALFLLIVAFIMMAVSAGVPSGVERGRIELLDQANLFLGVVSAPVQKTSQLVEHVSGLSDIAADLSRMRDENAKLKLWYERARQLEAENASLRGLVKLADLPRVRYVTARVIAESGTSFSQNILVDAGSNHALVQDSVALTGSGLIGRVMSVADKTAQITLITDVNSRIPVIIENSRHRGMLVGDNTGQPKLLYLPDDAAVSVGERVLTSGYGGVFAPGLPVGSIASIENGVIRIKPFVDLRRLDIVQLVYFGRSNLISSSPFAAQYKGDGK